MTSGHAGIREATIQWSHHDIIGKSPEKITEGNFPQQCNKHGKWGKSW